MRSVSVGMPCSRSALRLRNIHPAYCRRHVLPRQQLGLDRRLVLLQVIFERGDADNTRHPCRSPQVLRTYLHAYACRIYAVAFRASFGLYRYWPAHPATSPHPLPVRQASALPAASSRFAVARDTLAVRLTLPLAGCEEKRTSTSKYMRPAGRTQKKERHRRPFDTSLPTSIRTSARYTDAPSQ